ncbi:MAG TPA: type II restriction endonuclease [Candidatus Gastranaerophilales bacterium]|nr:type II restriction endonuclease [Candidatus Gastranaerophilales bacterium]
MKKGFLSEYFEGVAAKRLSAVEIDSQISHQHEFNGVNGLRKMLGNDRQNFKASYIYISESEDETLADEGTVTWYDARENHPTRTEYRLYYTGNDVLYKAEQGDLLVIGKKPDNEMVFMLAKQGTTPESQLLWLFNIEEDIGTKFAVKEFEDTNDRDISYSAGIILEHLGIEVIKTDENLLDVILQEFPAGFPSTKLFSEFARKIFSRSSDYKNSSESPDNLLVSWMEQEEILFKTLEKYMLKEKLNKGFSDDVDEFIKFSLSVHNRRKARVGQALENHMEEIFRLNNIKYSRGEVTENKSKPDFVFPGIKEYREEKFSSALLNMLGVKSTCKDRWRQVLSEAARIKEKHLFTLEPSISEAQTSEMKASNLRLVVPVNIQKTYTANQQNWLIGLNDFIELIKGKQAKAM